MNIEQSKKLSIIDFLDKENVTLKKKKGNAYWYLSPFRDEKTASFKVSKKENRGTTTPLRRAVTLWSW